MQRGDGAMAAVGGGADCICDPGLARGVPIGAVCRRLARRKVREHVAGYSPADRLQQRVLFEAGAVERRAARLPDFRRDPAPEPDTLALMILGFGSAGAMLRRRRRSSSFEGA
ncbi:MAG: PEPxxWA-CTERM sorting domain-containing protein [Alphaproteobacteria bacterium]